MMELPEKVLRLVGGKSKFVFHPLRIDDFKQLQLDIALVKGKLAWEPKVQLEDGLNETTSYFRRLSVQ